MVFTDLLFLFFFLPISVLLYKVVKNIKIQNILLVYLAYCFMHGAILCTSYF